MPIVKSYFTFLLNPKGYTISKSKNKLAVFVTVLLITYALILLASFVPSDQIVESGKSKINIDTNLLILFLIPLYEESLFRLPLKITALNISISVSVFISSIILVLANILLNIHMTLLQFYLLAVALSIPFFVISKKLYSQRTEAFLLKNYNYLFYASLILFASFHFYSMSFSLSALLTYLIYGYSLSFLRVSINFLNCLIMHFIFIAPLLLQLF